MGFVCIKDLELTSGLRTTMGSHIKITYPSMIKDRSQYSFRGGIILGKTNTPEFGAGQH